MVLLGQAPPPPKVFVPKAAPEVPRIYLQASPNNLHKPDLVGRILRREQARFVCLVHDLIPIQFPEYARPGGASGRNRSRTGAHPRP